MVGDAVATLPALKPHGLHRSALESTARAEAVPNYKKCHYLLQG
jgi:hypothetical protein